MPHQQNWHINIKNIFKEEPQKENSFCCYWWPYCAVLFFGSPICPLTGHKEAGRHDVDVLFKLCFSFQLNKTTSVTTPFKKKIQNKIKCTQSYVMPSNWNTRKWIETFKILSVKEGRKKWCTLSGNSFRVRQNYYLATILLTSS